MSAETGMNPVSEICIEDLCKAFGKHEILRGVSLDIRRGDVIAIVGGSGSGKTVLLNHILGLLSPDKGRVRVVDHGRDDEPLCDIAGLDAEELDRIHSYWGMVFQRNALFSGSVYDNISLGLKEVHEMTDADILPLARAALADVGLPGEDEFLALDHDQLSGGMSKRLAVARAIVMQPVVIFYDEPTTGLDPVSSAQIHDLIQQTHHTRPPGQHQVTTVIITHDKDLLSRLRPRTVMLHEGRVYFDGPFLDFESSDSAIIRPYFEQMPSLHGRATA